MNKQSKHASEMELFAMVPMSRQKLSTLDFVSIVLRLSKRVDINKYGRPKKKQWSVKRHQSACICFITTKRSGRSSRKTAAGEETYRAAKNM